MVLVTYASKPFEMTAKLAPRRPVALEAYKDEIEAAYNAVQASAANDVIPPSAWTSPEVLKFVRTIVYKVMEKEVGDDDDIFQQGGDRCVSS
jgi:hypothetical protein